MSFNTPPIDSTLPLSQEIHRLGLAHAESALTTLSLGEIHQTRRLLKRLRAILRLAAGDDTAAELAKNLRDIGRILSTIRDLEVSLELLPSFADQFSTRERKDLGNRLDPCGKRHTAIEQALPILRETRNSLQSWQPDVEWKDLVHAISRSYKEAFHHLKECSSALKKSASGTLSGADATPMHEMRKELKRLGHQLQFLPIQGEHQGAQGQQDSRAPTWMERKKIEAHRISQLLGQEHDLHVFEESLGTHVGPILPALNARRAVLQHDAIQRAGHFLRKKPDAFSRKLEAHLIRLREKAL